MMNVIRRMTEGQKQEQGTFCYLPESFTHGSMEAGMSEFKCLPGINESDEIATSVTPEGAK